MRYNDDLPEPLYPEKDVDLAQVARDLAVITIPPRVLRVKPYVLEGNPFAGTKGFADLMEEAAARILKICQDADQWTLISGDDLVSMVREDLDKGDVNQDRWRRWIRPVLVAWWYVRNLATCGRYGEQTWKPSSLRHPIKGVRTTVFGSGVQGVQRGLLDLYRDGYIRIVEATEYHRDRWNVTIVPTQKFAEAIKKAQS